MRRLWIVLVAVATLALVAVPTGLAGAQGASGAETPAEMKDHSLGGNRNLAKVDSHLLRALGLEREIGSLEVGKQADIVMWEVERPSMLSYRIGVNPCAAVMQAGIWRDREGLA